MDYVVERLPLLVHRALEAALRQAYPFPLSSKRVSDLLSRAIKDVDAAITSDFLSIFIESNVEVATVRSDRMKALLNSGSAARSHHARVSRMLGGTTALLTLFEEKTGNLWVANLGDCTAGGFASYHFVSKHDVDSGTVLGVWNGSRWKGMLINSIHNGSNAQERDRIISEHPAHEQCMVEERVLGWLAPTRGMPPSLAANGCAEHV